MDQYKIFCKRKWLRYLHDHISDRFDGRASQVRDMLYKSDIYIEPLNCQKVYEFYDDAYPELLTLEQFIREEKIKLLFD